MTEPLATPLLDAHRAAGGKIVEFAGFLMPVSYPSGVIAEHKAVRSAAGLFDVSHMGQVEVRGPAAAEAVQRLCANQVATLPPGKAAYTVMCNHDGGIVDDTIVSRLGSERFLLVTNAGCRDKDWAWIRDRVAEVPGASAHDHSDDWALVAIQGPKARAILRRLTETDLAPKALKRFRIAAGGVAGHTDVRVAGIPAMISRTGYTGENGYEVFVAPDRAAELWAALLDTGRDDGLVPVGLGARDTLRLEMGYMLYGNDIDETTSPIEAGLSWVVKPDAGDFIGKPTVLQQLTEGPPRKLLGLTLVDRGVPRHGYPVQQGGQQVGQVTSGAHSPSLGVGIALALVQADAANAETFEIMVRGRALRARVTPPPFYRPEKSR